MFNIQRSIAVFNVSMSAERPCDDPFYDSSCPYYHPFFFFLLTLAFIIYILRIWIPKIGRLHAYKETTPTLNEDRGT